MSKRGREKEREGKEIEAEQVPPIEISNRNFLPRCLPRRFTAPPNANPNIKRNDAPFERGGREGGHAYLRVFTWRIDPVTPALPSGQDENGEDAMAKRRIRGKSEL